MKTASDIGNRQIPSPGRMDCAASAYGCCERRTDMLTAKQEQFAQNIIKGMTQADAYRSAYNTNRMADKTIHENASRLANDSKVKARINELRGQISTENIMTAQKRLEWLTELVMSNEEAYTGDKLKAIDIMNKMTGEYVQRVEAEVTNAVNINIELSDD
jgi:phage terminase small subunit